MNLALDLVNDEHYQIDNTPLRKINQVKSKKFQKYQLKYLFVLVG
jgi:hypothetical protein